MADLEVRFRNPVQAAGFAQMLHVMTLDPEISAGAYRYYALLLFYAQQKGVCWPGRETLAGKMNKDARTITRYNIELEKAGYIKREVRPNQSSITWIEDPYKNDRLILLAHELLGDRDGSDKNVTPGSDKNVTLEVTKMSPIRRTIEEEQSEEEQSPPAEDAGQGDDYIEPSLEILQCQVDEDGDGTTFTCPHQPCGQSLTIREAEGGMCPHCHSRIKVYRGMRVVVKPAKQPYRPDPLSLASLIAGISPRLAQLRCRDEAEADHLRELMVRDLPHLLKMINWAWAQHSNEHKFPREHVIHKALRAFENNPPSPSEVVDGSTNTAGTERDSESVARDALGFLGL